MKSTAETSGTSTRYQLRISLSHISPTIWRRIQVDDCTLADLHTVIQAAMGWLDYHDYRFDIRGAEYGDPTIPDANFWDREDASRTLLSTALRGKRPVVEFHYEYDFGNGWEHDLLIEKAWTVSTGPQSPLLLNGERACPPENIGGPWRYKSLLGTLDNPDRKDREPLWGYLVGNFDPERFDCSAAALKVREFSLSSA